MSRSAPASRDAVRHGWVYTGHFLPGLPAEPVNGHQAKHYTGWCEPGRLKARQAEEARGGPKSPKILRAQLAQGGTWQLISVESGTRDLEIQRKYRGASGRCYLCAPDGEPGELGWVYILHLDPPRRAGRAAAAWAPAHRAGFTADTQALIAATRDSGRDAPGALELPRPRAGGWRLITAHWAPRHLAGQLAGEVLEEKCTACHPQDTSRAGHLATLAAISRGEVAYRCHPRHGWAVRWHTRDGQPLVTAGRGGDQGRNVTAAAAVLVERGLAAQAPLYGPDGSCPFTITAAGLAALESARAGRRRPGGRPDGLPANRDGSLSRSRTTDEEKQAAGVQTTRQKLEHGLLRALDHPRPAERVTGRLPDDQWTVVPALAADPSWASGVRDGIAAAARRPAGPPGRRALSRGGAALPAVRRPSA